MSCTPPVKLSIILSRAQIKELVVLIVASLIMLSSFKLLKGRIKRVVHFLIFYPPYNGGEVFLVSGDWAVFLLVIW